jgi:phosphate transport system substrate-binding protein
MSKSDKTSVKIVFSALSILGISLLSACGIGESPANKSIKIDGSSTVYPITQAVAEKFKSSQPGTAEVSVKFSGTSGGFREFCEGKTDISNASRPIQADEMSLCNRYGVRYIELPVAFDALTVVVNQENNWIDSITLEELKKMWEPAAEGKITNWNQIRPEFPNKPLNLFGAGQDSGTFDYFTEAVVGKSGASRKDYVASEDDNTLVQGVSQDPNALGYFGLAYYEQNPQKLKALGIDSGKGAILPSRETVVNSQYQPLARPLFIYVNAEKAQKSRALQEFVEYYLDNAESIVKEVGYIPLTDEHYHLATVTFFNGEVGTVFGGQSQFDVTLAELLRQKAKF